MSTNQQPSSRPEVYRREQERDAASAATHYRFPDKPFPHSMLLVFKQYDYSNFKNESYGRVLRSGVDATGRLVGVDRGDASVSLRTERSIELPFPKQLQDSTKPIINQFQRDPTMESIADSMKNFLDGQSSTISDIPGMIQNMGANVASALASGGTGGIGRAVNGVARAIGGTDVQQAAVMATYLSRSVLNALPGDIARSINTATGEIINPRETLAFEGVELRTHQFSWDLYPSNTNDSKRIQEIIKIIKRSILPRTQGISAGDFRIGKAFLKYPHVLEMYLIGVRDDYFMKFKPCFVTDMSVDYAAGGTLGIMKGGKPAGVTITMTMQELQIETAEDYGEPSLDDIGGEMANETDPPAAPSDPAQTGPQ